MAKDIKVKTRYVTKDIKTINRAKLLFGKLRIADAKIRTLRSKSEDERDSLTPESYGANKAEEVGKLGIDTALASVKMRGLRSRNMNAAADKISSNKAAINEAARRADTHPVNNTAQLKTQKTFIGRGSLHGLSPTAKSGGVHEKSARSFAGSRNTYGEKSIRKAGVYDQSRLSGASILKSRHINAQAKSLAMRNAKKKNAGATAKVSASAFSRTVKSILAAVKSLWVLLSAGGFAAVLAVIIITIVSIVAGSAFGIFFTGESSAGGWLPLKAAVSELTNEFAAEIESIKINNPHDELKMEIPGSNPSIDWKQVLAVFAVASAEDAVNPMPVSSFDEHNLNRLRAVMFDMNNVHSSVHTEFYTRTMPVIDGEPDTSEIVTVTILTISITKKNTDEMVLQYAFTKSQKESLAELLAKENDALWAELLGSIAPGGRGIPSKERIPLWILCWPLEIPGDITSRFGWREDPLTKARTFHYGTDIAAPANTPILAAADGTVSISNSADSFGGGLGYFVKISHASGLETMYAHCSSVAVRTGEYVSKGQIIAYVGSTGKSNGNHLHWEVAIDGECVDALAYFE